MLDWLRRERALCDWGAWTRSEFSGWRTRAGSLRGSARGFNVPSYSRDDVGFRVVCECR